MEILIKSNPGLKSRFSLPIRFHDFTTEDLDELLQKKLAFDELVMPDDVKDTFLTTLELKRQEDPTSFGNARDLLAYYERAKDHLAVRIMEHVEKGGKRKTFLPANAQQFTLEDITGEGYTVVVESPDETPSMTNKRLKSWVIPNR
jgi:hypothetical protein